MFAYSVITNHNSLTYSTLMLILKVFFPSIFSVIVIYFKTHS